MFFLVLILVIFVFTFVLLHVIFLLILFLLLHLFLFLFMFFHWSSCTFFFFSVMLMLFPLLSFLCSLVFIMGAFMKIIIPPFFIPNKLNRDKIHEGNCLDVFDPLTRGSSQYMYDLLWIMTLSYSSADQLKSPRISGFSGRSPVMCIISSIRELNHITQRLLICVGPE